MNDTLVSEKVSLCEAFRYGRTRSKEVKCVCGSLMHNVVLTNSRVPSDLTSFNETQRERGGEGTVPCKGAAEDAVRHL